MIGSFKLFHCKTKKFELKIKLIKQANSIIDNKLDIVFYIRNMILFEMINKIYLENKNITNFLSRPIIYLNESKFEEKPKFDLSDIDNDILGDDNKNKKKEKSADFEMIKYLKDDNIYKTAYIFDSNNLISKIEKLIIKPDKTDSQKKLIYFLKKHLNGV